jgi:hypothetical protein
MRDHRKRLCLLAMSASLALPVAGISTVLSSTAASAQVVLDPVLGAITLHPVEGTKYSGKVANVNLDSLPDNLSLNGSTTTIDWGDGTPLDTTSGGFDGDFINGSHKYVEAGTYQIKVTTTPVAPSPSASPSPDVAKPHISITSLTTTSTAKVKEAPTSLWGEDPVVVFGGAFNGLVANGEDRYPGIPKPFKAKLDDFSAVIDWGDGSSTTSCTTCITGTGGKNFDVKNKHQYTHAGIYLVSTVVSDGSNKVNDGEPATTEVIVPLVANAVTTTGEGTEFNGVVGSTLTEVSVEVASRKTGILLPIPTVTIDWGDGTAPTTGSVNLETGNVSGKHTYAEEGTYSIVLTLQENLGEALAKVAPLVSGPTATNKVTVPDAAISASAVTSNYNITTGQSVSGKLAHLIDAAGNGTLSDFSAVIDWGDGSTSVGTVAVNTGGGYDISGAHNYTSAGTKQAKVTVNDVGGSTSNAPFTVTVTAPVVPVTGGTPNSGVKGVISVPNTGGGELPLAPAMLLVAAGGALFVAGRRRMR